MRLNLRVTYNDGLVAETAAGTADLVAFEDEFDRSVARLEVEMRLKDLCWLAWRSLTRRSLTSADFGPWLETVDEVQLFDGAASPVPLEPSPSTSE